jgi:cell wall-associated NlpC family hydrolase
MPAHRRTSIALACAVAAALSLGLVDSARADSSPTVSPTPTSTSATPTPTPSPTKTSTKPTPTPTSATPTPSGSTQPPVDPALPPNDGAAPAPGTVDQFLSLTAQRDPAVRVLDSATHAYNAAHALAVQTQQQVALLGIARAQLQVQSDAARATTDDVVNSLYQSGDDGLGAMIQIMSVGPDGFISSLDNAFKARRASNAIVYAALKAKADVTFAGQVEAAVRITLQQHNAAEQAAAAALAKAKASLSSIDAQLGALATTAPTLPLDADGCPLSSIDSTLRDGSAAIGAEKLCHAAIAAAATPQAALAIGWAFRHLGAAYACGGAGRMLPYRADCSSFVSRAYHEGAGLSTASLYDAPSTRDMVPWGGASLDPHYALVEPKDLKPGDLVLYDTCPASGSCAYRHVVMYLGTVDGHAWMVHTSSCGDVAHVSAFWGTGGGGPAPFLVARRVVALAGDPVHVGPPTWTKAHPNAKP